MAQKNKKLHATAENCEMLCRTHNQSKGNR